MPILILLFLISTITNSYSSVIRPAICGDICSTSGCLDTDYVEFVPTHSIHDNAQCITPMVVDAAEEASLNTFKNVDLETITVEAKATLIADAESVYKTSTAKGLFENAKQAAVSKLRDEAELVEVTGTDEEKNEIIAENNVKKISLMAALKNQAKQNRVNARQMREDRRTKRTAEANGQEIDVAPTKPTKASSSSKTAKTKYAVETRAIVLESKMVIEKNDLPDFMASSLLTTTKPIAYVFADAYVADESPNEDCVADGVEVCCTFDIATDSDSTILVAVDEVIGAWSVLCDGETIISKQTRTSNTDSVTGIAVYDMQCWDGTDFATVKTKNSGETLECPNYTVIIGSEAAFGDDSCNGTVLGPDATGFGDCSENEAVGTTCTQLNQHGNCLPSTCGNDLEMVYGLCTSTVYGCTFDTALNYNSNANADDGSCIYPVYGCTDALADNFDSNADTNDGSCIYPVLGCTDATADNFDYNANTNDGSCIYPGCTDDTADNFDSNANADDGTCTYSSPSPSPSSGANPNADPVCLHPDVPVHILNGLSVEKVAVKTLKPGDVVIGEGRTSTVKRVETFQVEDEACVVPKDLCGGFAEQVLVSKTHAIRCPEWPANTWTFCQPEWPRVATTEYVHVELESYLKDHILSGSIVLESWDGYARESDTIEDACSERGCPWPHKWESTGEKRWKRVDLRQILIDSTPRLRIKR